MISALTSSLNETDLDFEDDALKSTIPHLPLGCSESSGPIAYTGTFDGEGHSVKNLKLNDGSRPYSGLFCSVSRAKFKNLIIDDSCVFKGENASALSIFIRGDIELCNVEVYATVEANVTGGGILGSAIAEGNFSIKISHCVFGGRLVSNGNVEGPLRWGGFIAAISSCENIHLLLDHNLNIGIINASFPNTQASRDPFIGIGGSIGTIEGGSNVFLNATDNVNEVEVTLVPPAESISYVGGFIGSFEPSWSVFKNNTNNGSIIFNAYNAKLLSAGGFVGCCNLSKGIYFDSNANNVFFNASGTCPYAYYGGVLGMIDLQTGSFNEAPYVKIINNTNNGNAVFDMRNVTTLSVGGLLGVIKDEYDFVLDVENNTNNAMIEGSFNSTFNSTSLYVTVGGAIGMLLAKSTQALNIRGNTNKGSINIVVDDVKEGYAAGIVGALLSLSSIDVKDNSNYGDISVKAVQQQQTSACGIACISFLSSSLSISNCINSAKIIGNNAYGISDYLTVANNIVSIGEVIGSEESYSFWKDSSEPGTSLYALNGRCENCHDNDVTLIMKNATDGQYHTVEKSELVCALLNKEAEESNCSLRWDNNLQLRSGKPVSVTITDPINIELQVLEGMTLAESGLPGDVLSFFESKDYVAGDINTNEILHEDTPITRDMNIIVMKRHEIVLEMKEKEILSIVLDSESLAKELELFTGVEKANFLIDIEVDSEGYALRVIVVLKTEEIMNKIVPGFIECMNQQDQ